MVQVFFSAFPKYVLKNSPTRFPVCKLYILVFYQILERLKLVVINVVLCPCRLDEISGAASKEFGLEKAMEKMKVEWKDMYFEFIPYRDTVSGQRTVYEDGHNCEQSFEGPHIKLSSPLPFPLRILIPLFSMISVICRTYSLR